MTDDLITDMQQTVNDARKQYGDDWELTSIHVPAGKLARLCELAACVKPQRDELPPPDAQRPIWETFFIPFHEDYP